MEQSRAITRKSASNLALAFILLPREKRDGMSALYAFCREVDDIADDESVPVEKETDPVTADAALGDRCSMLWSGTLLTQGTARGLAGSIQQLPGVHEDHGIRYRLRRPHTRGEAQSDDHQGTQLEDS